MALTSASKGIDLPWRRALVVGLGVSGIAASKLLHAAGVEVIGFDKKRCPDELQGIITPVVGHDDMLQHAFEGVDAIVLSPGVPPFEARRLAADLCPQAKIVGELGLGLQAIEQLSGDLPTVMITGTNGKSTVTAMLGDVLCEAGHQPFIGGNFGLPLCGLALSVLSGHRAAPSHLVLECSSYQLETLRQVHCDVAMLLNISPDHIDRYESMEHYAATKAVVFDLIRDETSLGLIGFADSWCHNIAANRGHQIQAVDGTDVPRLTGGGGESVLLLRGGGESWNASNLNVVGRHNALNALFVIEAARHLGVERRAWDAALKRFDGLPHRMKFVSTVHGVDYYNDSKATNVASVLASLRGFAKPVVLIAGGRAKGESLTDLRRVMQEGGIGLVAIGESKADFLEMGRGVVPCVQAEGMDAAVRAAAKMAGDGAAVVLSPACASWDMYRSYAHRGEQFEQAVQRLVESESLKTANLD